jgi:hypothetical protein
VRFIAENSQNKCVTREENIIFFTAGEQMSQQMIEQAIHDIEGNIRDWIAESKKSQLLPRKKTGKCPDCAVILNFQEMSRTDMIVDQMAQFIELMVKYNVHNVVSIPPPPENIGKVKIIELLNHSLPIFGKKGIWVLIVDSLEKARQSLLPLLSLQLAPPLKTVFTQPLTIHLAGVFEGRPLHQDVIVKMSGVMKVNEILLELNKKLNMTIFSPESVTNNKFFLIYNGTHIDSRDVLKVNVKGNDELSIIQPIGGHR